MNDIYKKQISSEQRIYLLLLEIIPDPNICKKIISMKKRIEQIETMNYHYDLWLNIALKYYKAEKNKMGKFSYILDEEDFYIRPDHEKEYFRNTGVSYQIKDMVNKLLLLTDKEWIEHDDLLYSQLLNLALDLEFSKLTTS